MSAHVSDERLAELAKHFGTVSQIYSSTPLISMCLDTQSALLELQRLREQEAERKKEWREWHEFFGWTPFQAGLSDAPSVRRKQWRFSPGEWNDAV